MTILALLLVLIWSITGAATAMNLNDNQIEALNWKQNFVLGPVIWIACLGLCLEKPMKAFLKKLEG